MTDPASGVAARRTVRAAVSIVAAQAVLGAVIGWLTLAGGPDRPASGREVTLAAPPAFPRILVPTLAEPSPRPTPTRSPVTAPATRRVASTTARTNPPQPPQQPPPQPPARPAEKVPPSAPSPSAGDRELQPTPAPTPEVQSPVLELDLCAPLDSIGLTAEGIKLLCAAGDDGVGRWRPA